MGLFSSIHGFLTRSKKCKVCDSFCRSFQSKDYYEGFKIMRELVKKEDITFYAGSCPLDELEKHLDLEDLYTIEHYFKCQCGMYYYTGFCIRGMPILRANEIPPKNIAKTISGHYGELFEKE